MFQRRKAVEIMKSTLIRSQAVLAVLVAMTLASGCSSTKRTARYWSDPSYSRSRTEVTTTTQETDQNRETAENQGAAQNSNQLSMTGETNTVIPLYKESVSVGKREVEAGSVRLKKIVKTETVNEPVELRHEEVVIERQPASENASTAANDAFQERETVIHLTKEEPVIQKQTTSSGQIVVRGRNASEQRNIQAQVRTEDVAVTKSGNAEDVRIGQNVQQGGEAAGGAESPSGQSNGQNASGNLITEPTMLSGSGAARLSGSYARLKNLKVQAVMGEHVAKCSAGDNGQPVYIYSTSGIANVKAGDSVNVSGVIRTGSAEVNGPGAQELRSQPAYIEAQSIEPAGQ
jgi:uncharacterized protein (TIGR02271 family)